MNRRRSTRLYAAVSLASLLAVGGTAFAAFTDTETNPQTISAANQFPGVGPDVTAQSSNDNPSDTNQISLRLQVTNTGDEKLELDQVTLRYWFTNDFGTTGVDSRCNYAPPPLSCSKVIRSTGLVEPARVGADRYLQLAFAKGKLKPGRQLARSRSRCSGRAEATRSTSPTTTATPRARAWATRRTSRCTSTASSPWGDEPGSRPATPGLRVRYVDLDGNPTNAQMSPGLIVDNTGAVPVALGQVKLRYWFSQNPGGATFQTFCDSAVIGCASVTHRVVAAAPARPKADRYLEVGFTGANRTLDAGSSTGEIRLRANLSNFANLDERDDYSWGPGPLRPWEKVTAYLGGTLLWGTPP